MSDETADTGAARTRLARCYGQLIALLRLRLDRRTLGHHVMPDPGIPGYVAALDRVLTHGTKAIEPCFDITENIGWGVNWVHARSDAFRWFRVLTSTIAIYLAELHDTVVPSHQGMAILMLDSLALDRSRRLGLREKACELARALPPTLEAPRDQVFCLLAELRLMSHASATDEQRAAAIVDAIESLHEEAQEPGCLVDDQWEPNVWYTGSPEFVWGLVDGCGLRPRETELLPVWIELLRSWSPTAPRIEAFRQRLLDEGRKWSSKPRRLS